MWKIIIHCKKIIIVPTGGSWTFFHVLRDVEEGKIFSASPDYLDRINGNINYILDKEIKLIKYYDL